MTVILVHRIDRDYLMVSQTLYVKGPFEIQVAKSGNISRSKREQFISSVYFSWLSTSADLTIQC